MLYSTRDFYARLMEAITISRYTNEVCISTHLHRERRDAIPSSGQRQPFCRRSAYMTRSQRERTAVARFVLNILPIVVLDGIVREGACIGAATILQPWTLRLILNGRRSSPGIHSASTPKLFIFRTKVD
jgi:hypothetical protein